MSEFNGLLVEYRNGYSSHPLAAHSRKRNNRTQMDGFGHGDQPMITPVCPKSRSVADAVESGMEERLNHSKLALMEYRYRYISEGIYRGTGLIIGPSGF